MAERYRFRPLTAIGTAIALSLAPQVSARAIDSGSAAAEAQLLATNVNYLKSIAAQQAMVRVDFDQKNVQVNTSSGAVSTVKPPDQTPATQPPQVIPVLTTTTTPSGTIKDGDTKANPTQEDMKKACWIKNKFSDENYTAVVTPKSLPANTTIGEMLPNCGVAVATWWLDESFIQIPPCGPKQYYEVITKDEKIAGFHGLNPSIIGPANNQSQLLSVASQTYANAQFEGIVDRNLNLQGQRGNTYTAIRDASSRIPTSTHSQIVIEGCTNRGTVYFVDQNTFSQPK